ncbi:MAG: insulinase family protein [Candidatus Zixiibacteriota bacterium]|nr:MAG: insulinase family protein [candidate division Zixibacteria bacterium]
MKKVQIYRPVALLLVLLIMSGCGEKAGQIAIGPDGYGKSVLSNGITVLVNYDETTSLTGARILIGGGVLAESAENNGITNLMTKMLLKGNDAMTASEISERLDYLGANVSINCFREYSVISFVSLTENFDQVLEIIAASLISPTFPEDELTKLKHEVEGNIKASDDNQTQASSKLFWKTIYGDRGYGLPTMGTPETIARVTVDDIKGHFQKYVGGRNIIFSAATDLPAEQIATIVNRRMGGIKPEADTVSAPNLTLQAEQTGFISYDRNQSFIFMGYVLDHLKADEVPYIVLLNEIMGNNVGSRLWSLRRKEKLAYAIYTEYSTGKYGAIFRAAIGTDTSKVKKALNSLNREWEKLIKDGITEEELAYARVVMKNNLIYGIDRKGGRANNMAFYEFIGYNYRFILDMIDMADRITLDDVNRFIGEKLIPDRKYTSIVGKK